MTSLPKLEPVRARGRLSRTAPTATPANPAVPRTDKDLRHRTLAETVVLDGESVQSFTALLTSLEAEHHPATPTQFFLIETMAINWWMQMRFWGFSKGVFDLEMAKLDRRTGNRPARASTAFRNLVESGTAFDKCQRYEASCRSQFKSAAAQLLQLKSRSNKASEGKKAELRNEPNPISEQSAGLHETPPHHVKPPPQPRSVPHFRNAVESRVHRIRMRKAAGP